MKDFANRVLEASINVGDHQLGEKCEVLQQKLDELLQTLNDEENLMNDETEDNDQSALRDDTSPSEQEKGVLEKPEKDMTNLKRVRKRKNHLERDAMMAR